MLRTPRIIWDASLERDVTILQYLRQHSKIPVPEVKAFDYTVKNPLKSPDVIQSRIPGMPLSAAARSGLSHEGWCTAAKEIGQIILEMQKLSHPHPGIIESSTDDGVQSFTVEPFDIGSPYDMEWKQKKLDAATKDSLRKDYEKSTLWFIAAQLERWRAKELRIEPTSILCRDHMHRLTDAASAMDRLHCLRHNMNCLSHRDLAARNIMVEISSDNSLSVTGVQNWDRACFAPSYVSCAPPWWLWQDESYGDIDAIEDESKADDEPPDAELQQVKQVFEDTVGDEFCRYAYHTQYPIARKLFNIALH